jgi:hypothetical protein
MKKHSLRFVLVPLLLAAACVGQTKSSNPLSPSIAGPIEGVGISAPGIAAPAVDALIDTGAQPITLQVSNAETNGVRPLSYRFEIASDPNFANAVFTKIGVAQDPAGKTSTKLPGPLTAERKYYWRARAEDGANTGPFGATSAFNVFTPVVFGSPVLVSPINGASTALQPVFVMNNANRSGPVGQVFYLLEVSTAPGFDSLLASWQFVEGAGQTQLAAPVSLSTGTYYWRARAFDGGGHTGPYSTAQSFRTSGGAGGGGGAINPNGNWQNCGSTPGPDVVVCVYTAINPPKTVDGAFEVTKRVAWLIRGSGFGLLRKDGGENVAIWNGRGFAAARIVLPVTGPDGSPSMRRYKLMSDVPNGAPQWIDEGLDPPLVPLWFAPALP